MIYYIKIMSNNNTPKFVDILEEDKAIAGQKFVCVSFISPENVLKQKNLFFFENFLKHFDFSKSMNKFQQFLNFMSFKYNLNFEKVMEDFQEFIKSEKDNLINDTIENEYKTFLDQNEDNLDKQFSEQHNFQTSVRGVKIRGSFPTQQEAELRCKLLRENDPHHDIFVGPVGVWMPWEPEAYKTGKVEYLEKELNELMHEKVINEEKAKQEFETRVKETKQKAIQENIERAKESGNKLTQSIDNQGNLIGVEGTNTTEDSINAQNEIITSADITKELFTGDNIRTKTTDKL
jgi:uncharacterized membrane protein YheB (UPF0754 family)